jgi:hypothetical protein
MTEVSIARAIFSVVGRGRKRHGGGGFTLGRGTTEQGARSRKDPGGLGTHAQDAAATRRQDLEIELVKTNTELFAGAAESFFDRLARELVVGIAKCSHS